MDAWNNIGNVLFCDPFSVCWHEAVFEQEVHSNNQYWAKHFPHIPAARIYN